MAMIKCPECQHEVSDTAEKCPNCGAAIKKKTSKLAKGCLGIVIAFVVLVVLAAMVTGGDDSKGASSVASNESNIREITVTANELMAQYKQNEIAADNNYKGAMLIVSGNVSSIGKDIMDNPYVVLRANGEILGVQCMLDDATKAATLKKGDNITVRGIGNGKMGNVLLKDCNVQ